MIRRKTRKNSGRLPEVKKYLDVDEKQLLGMISAGDERAYRIIFDRYQQRIYSFALFLTRSSVSCGRDNAGGLFEDMAEPRVIFGTH